MKEPVNIISEIELNSATISLRSDGIMQFDVKQNIAVSEKDAREMVDAAGKLGQGQKYPILIIAGKYSLAEKETREYAASAEGNRFTIAVAFVIKGLAQKILGNVYLKVNKPTNPTALFDSNEKAIEWLKGFVHNGINK